MYVHVYLCCNCLVEISYDAYEKKNYLFASDHNNIMFVATVESRPVLHLEQYCFDVFFSSTSRSKTLIIAVLKKMNTIKTMRDVSLSIISINRLYKTKYTCIQFIFFKIMLFAL